MPRAPHENVAGGIYHVTSRGNRREPLFLDDYDFHGLVRQLARTIERFGWRCHAYCLIPNHYHVLVETPEPNLSHGMLVLNGSYARRFNTRYGTVGHVFQGPFRAAMVQRDEHFLETGRYIALNAVRAGLCTDPSHWPWSSYRALAGYEPAPPFLCTDFVHAMFGGRAGYRRFVTAGLEAGNGGCLATSLLDVSAVSASIARCPHLQPSRTRRATDTQSKSRTRRLSVQPVLGS